MVIQMKSIGFNLKISNEKQVQLKRFQEMFPKDWKKFTKSCETIYKVFKYAIIIS